MLYNIEQLRHQRPKIPRGIARCRELHWLTDAQDQTVKYGNKIVNKQNPNRFLKIIMIQSDQGKPSKSTHLYIGLLMVFFYLEDHCSQRKMIHG